MRNCPICGLDKKIKLHELHFAFEEGFPLPLSNDIVYCNNCGLVYADNNSDQEKYDKYYFINNA